jgi:hypothetical protein
MRRWLTDFMPSVKTLENFSHTITLSLYSLGDEMSRVCDWLTHSRGKYIVTGKDGP